MNRAQRLLVAGAMAAVTVLIPAGPAWSDPAPPIPLDDGNKGTGSHMGSPGATYSFTTSSSMWSVVEIVPQGVPDTAYVDYDLTITDASGATLAQSIYGGRTVDFVAIDSNLRGPGPYLARVNLYGGYGYYSMGWRQKNLALPPAGSPQPVYTMQSWDQAAMIKDVYLNAGECLAVKAWRFTHNTGELMVMASDPTHPVQGRSSAAARVAYGPADGSVTLRYTAPRAGSYGFVISNRTDDIPSTDTAAQYQRIAC